MKHNFEKAGFSLQDAREFNGKLCRVTCAPSKSFPFPWMTSGVIRPITRTTTFVGDTVVFNNEVLEVDDGLAATTVRQGQQEKGQQSTDHTEGTNSIPDSNSERTG